MAIDMHWEQGVGAAQLYLGDVMIAEVTRDRRSSRTQGQQTFEIEVLLPGVSGRYRTGSMATAREAAEQQVNRWIEKTGVE